MWNELQTNNTNTNVIQRNIKKILKYSELFSISKNNLLELLDNGYHDANKNRDHLNNIFTQKRIDEE